MTSKKNEIFYGWIVLSGAVLALFVTGGSFTHSFGVFLPEIAEESGWSRASLSTALSLGIMANGFLSPLWGVLVTRLGSRKSIIIGNSLAAIGVAGIFSIQEIWHLYLLYFVIGLGAGLAGFVATTNLANNWFIKKTPLAMGIIAAAGGLSGFAFPPIVATLISSIGWRSSWLVLAVMVFIGAVLIGGCITIRNKPEEKGQVPDGIDQRGFVDANRINDLSRIGGQHQRLKLRDIIRLPSIWSIVIFAMASGFTIGTMTTHQIAYLRDLGLSSIVSSTTLSVWSAMSIISSILFGILALRFSVKLLVSLAFCLQLIAFTILLTFEDLALLYVYSGLLGMSIGALVAALPTLVGAYFGRNHYAQIVSIIFALHIFAFAAGGPLAGFIFDITDTYKPAFAVVTTFSLIGLISMIITRPPPLSYIVR